MLHLTRLLEALLLPPGLFVLCLGAALVLGWRSRLRAAGVLTTATALGLYLVATPLVAGWLLAPLENRYPPSVEAQAVCDVIVVLGGGARVLPGAAPPEEVLGADGLRRTLAALRLWRKQPRPLLLTGGPPNPDEPVQSEQAAALLRALGVPAGEVQTVPTSRTTHEEAAATARIAAAVGWRRPCLVTSALHLPRAVASFAHFGLHVVPVPSDALLETDAFSADDLVPSAGALAISRRALHEVVGMAWYRLRYGVRLP